MTKEEILSEMLNHIESLSSLAVDLDSPLGDKMIDRWIKNGQESEKRSRKQGIKWKSSPSVIIRSVGKCL